MLMGDKLNSAHLHTLEVCTAQFVSHELLLMLFNVVHTIDRKVVAKAAGTGCNTMLAREARRRKLLGKGNSFTRLRISGGPRLLV